ncbi:MAG: hypothetical protein OHK0039_45390 [Bacteroidia bacterium]
MLAVHSLAAHGSASLKVLIRLLGHRVLPVPSLYLNGLTNLPAIRRYRVEFASLLASTLELAALRDQELILYVGYLGEAAQADIIRAQLDLHRDRIRLVLVDPVTGDHGRIYVPEAVVSVWPDLLAQADWALPNQTELYLYGQTPAAAPVDEALDRFAARYPHLHFVATGLDAGAHLRVHLRAGAQRADYEHARTGRNYGDTGDVFAGHFIRRHLLDGEAADGAMRAAAMATADLIAVSAAQGLDDLAI